MPVDVRINRVTTDLNVTDASAMLTPQILERITQAVLARLEEQQRSQREADQDRTMGASRNNPS
jgi:hypothetical protein